MLWKGVVIYDKKNWLFFNGYAYMCFLDFLRNAYCAGI